MPFPVVQATDTSIEALSTTSHTVDLPSGIQNGDLLIVFFMSGNPPGTMTWPSGWTGIDFGDFGQIGRMRGAYVQADGTEGATITVTTGNSITSGHLAYRITGSWVASQAPEWDVDDATGGGSGPADPPDHTPTGGAKDYLWIATAFSKDDPVSEPTDYGGYRSASASGHYLVSAYRSLNAASENPGTFNSGNDDWAAITMAVHPSPDITVEPLPVTMPMVAVGALVSVLPPITIPTSLVEEYTVRIRNPSTLALVADLPRYESLQWTRRPVEEGRFTLVIDHDDLPGGLTDIDTNNIVEIKRDTVFEFAGAIETQEYDAANKHWKVGGRDLKAFWLSKRVIDPVEIPEPPPDAVIVVEFDSVTNVAAETAIIYYINNHLVSPHYGPEGYSQQRAIGNEISVSFLMPMDAKRGPNVSFDGRYQNLFDVVSDFVERADLLHEVVITSGDDYQYRLRTRRDATRTTGAVPVVFSTTAHANVAHPVYREQVTKLHNFIYVMGEGSGQFRNVSYVKDAASISADFRREVAIDARDATSVQAREFVGELEIARGQLDRRGASVEPLLIGPNLYRSAWDLGDDVTLSFDEIGKEVDRRIDEVVMTLDRSGERINIKLGRRPQTLAPIINKIAKHSGPSQMQ